MIDREGRVTPRSPLRGTGQRCDIVVHVQSGQKLGIPARWLVLPPLPRSLSHVCRTDQSGSGDYEALLDDHRTTPIENF